MLVVVADGLETLSGFLLGLWAWPRRVLKEEMDERGGSPRSLTEFI